MAIAVALWIDDADYIDDHSEEALEYLLKLLDQLGIRVTFKIAGEKIRALNAHGRSDLIRALSVHDICYHTQFHSLHPTVVEYLEKFSFSEGAVEFEKREIDGLYELRDVIGKRIDGYGHPGEAWSPDVCPVMIKHGADVCLDDHFILNVHGQAFSYGGMLNLNGLKRIIRYDYHNESGLSAAKRQFDVLAETECGFIYPEYVRLFSVFYHPGEFYMAEHMSDMYNFRDGKNIPFDDKGNFLGYKLPPTISKETAHHYMDLVGEYLKHMIDTGAHFVTASELRKMHYTRKRLITSADVKHIAKSFSSGAISFLDVGGEFMSASEAFILLRQYLKGKPLSPYLMYGPDLRENSHIVADKTISRAEVARAMDEVQMIFGYPMLKSLYSVGAHCLTPIDLCVTAAYMVATDVGECIPKRGILTAEEYVCGPSDWGGRWLFPKKLDVSNTYEKTKLQCWTLKPIRY